MSANLELFSTSTCHKCEKLAEFLSRIGISYIKRVIDEDPVAETDALVAHISSAPSLKKGKVVLRTKDMFDGDIIIEEKVRNFVAA